MTPSRKTPATPCRAAGRLLPALILAAAPLAVHAQAAADPSLPPHPPATTRFFPLEDVHRGQHGVAYTVFEGVDPEPMGVEILGVLKDSLGPGQDMILARLHGTKPEYTGVVAGMSGSPVYIDGKLLGALSYRIGQFSREPIAGITPIAQMLEVRDLPAEPRHPSSHDPEVVPMDTSLSFSGVSADTLALFADRFGALGLTPVAGLGGASPETPQPEPIVPGSAISAILMDGDMNSAVTCTVTYVDPRRLLACGHPFTGSGAVDMPMTKTTVVSTLASPLNAFKIVNTTVTVGAFTQDRASAILGVFGQQARMIPIAVTVSGPHAGPAADTAAVGEAAAKGPGSADSPDAGAAAASGPPAEHTFHYRVLDNAELTPNIVLVAVYQSLHDTNRAGVETSYRLSGELRVEGQPPVELHALIAPTETVSAAIGAALYLNKPFTRVYGNPVSKPTLTGLDLHLEAIPERRSATLLRASVSRSEAHAGDTVEVSFALRPYHGATREVRLPVQLPESLPPGPVRLLVSDAASVDQLVAPPAKDSATLSLADTVAELNRHEPNDRVYCSLLERVPEAIVAGGALPELPLSMAKVLEPLRAEGRATISGESVVRLASKATGYAVTGSSIVTLNIR